MSGFRPRFFLSSSLADGFAGAGSTVSAGSIITLDAEDSHHALRVLRLRAGDECEVVVGAAVHAATVLSAPSGGRGGAVELRLGPALEGAEAGARYSQTVALVQAHARPSALDWSIEKSTEAGVSLVILVQAAGSPDRAGKGDAARQARWARIAREAAKQSKQPAVPPVEEAPSLAVALQRVRDLGLVSLLLDPGADQGLHEYLAGEGALPAGAAGAAGVALWVGPEGGWTDSERDGLLRADLIPVRLGRGVLRTETAGPVAVAVARLALGDW